MLIPGWLDASHRPLMPLKIQHDEAPALNLTSMIDVLFLLIIFFMVATKFDELERNIEVAVPEVAQSGDDDSPPEPIIVTVQSDGTLAIGGDIVTSEQLVDTPDRRPVAVERAIRSYSRRCRMRVSAYRNRTGRLSSGRYFGTGNHRPNGRDHRHDALMSAWLGLIHGHTMHLGDASSPPRCGAGDRLDSLAWFVGVNPEPGRAVADALGSIPAAAEMCSAFAARPRVARLPGNDCSSGHRARAAAVRQEPPIRVRIVQDSGEQDAESPASLADRRSTASAPQLFEPIENDVESAATDEQATDEQVVEAPQLMEPPRETNEPAIVE